MRTLAILPIKSFGAAKQRLAPLLGGGSREALAQAMFSDVVASLVKVKGLDAVAVVTGDSAAESACRGGRVLVLTDAVQAGQSAAAQIGIRHAQEAGFDRVLLVPGDTPLMDPIEIDAMLVRATADGHQLVIVPDRHGEGTNALLMCPPGVIDPSFGPASLERHVAAARERGLRFAVDKVDSLVHDVDTPDDLAEMAALLDARRAIAPRTRGALRQLDRSRVCGTAPRQRRPAVLGRPVEISP